MEVGKLTVRRRHHTGKGVARKLRSEGRIPGVCYGVKVDAPIPIDVDTRALKGSLDPVKRHNTLIDVTIEDDGAAPQNVTVMVLDYQIDKIRREVTHVDLVAIDTERPVEVQVPIEFTGKPAGLVLGGQLHVVLRELDVRCRPADIPARVALDITELDIGDVLHISDIDLPEGVVATSTVDQGVITCTAPEVEAAEEAAGAEGEGEAAAAPAAAEGDKAAS